MPTVLLITTGVKVVAEVSKRAKPWPKPKLGTTANFTADHRRQSGKAIEAIRGGVVHQSQGLFRQEVIDTQAASSLGKVRLATPVSHLIWTLATVGVAASITAWLFLGRYTRRVHVTGLLVPQAGLVTVTANANGIIDQISVSEGKTVHIGDILISISDAHDSRLLGHTSEDISDQLQFEEKSLLQDMRDTDALEIQQAEDNRLQQSMLKGQLAQLTGQLAIETKQVALSQDLVTKYQPLLSKGDVSLLQVNQEQSALLGSQNQYKSLMQQRFGVLQQLSALNDQLAQLPLATSAKLNELRRQLAQVKQALVQNETTRSGILRAPTSGVVSSLLVKPGASVAPMQPLLAIVPQGSMLQAQLLVPSQAVGFVHAGTEVTLHYLAFPYQKFGLQKGKVLSVSRSALLPNEVNMLLGGGQLQSPEPLYLVTVGLAAQSVLAYGRQEPLKPGMALEADLLLDRRRMIEWIFEPLYGIQRRWAKA